MKINIFKFIGFFVLIAFLASCDKEAFEEYDSTAAQGAPTITVTIDSNTDSTLTVSYNMNMAGRVTIALVPASVDDATVADMEARIIDGAVYIDYFKHDDGDAQATITYKELMPYTSYKVFGLGNNTTGIPSVVVVTDAVATSDFAEPTLDLDEGLSPAISSSADQSTDFDITLTFSEPVVLATAFDIELGYYDPISKTIDWISVVKDSISISSNAVTIKHMKAGLINGERVYLSITEGSITDKTGNKYEGISSGRDVDDDGDSFSFGIYWRVSWDNKAELEVMPTDADFITDAAAFQVIKLVYPIELSAASLDDYESSFIKVRYYDSEISTDYNVPVEDLVLNVDTLEIYIPKTAEYGSNVALSIAEGAVWDVYGNDIAAVEFADYDWFISYGYTRDMYIGNYSVQCYNYGSVATDVWDVTVTADPDSDDGIIMKGYFGLDTAIVAYINGDLATMEVEYRDEEGYLNVDFGDIGGADTYTTLYNSSTSPAPIPGWLYANGDMEVAYMSAITWANADGSFVAWYETVLYAEWTKETTKQEKSVVKKRTLNTVDLIDVPTYNTK